MAVVVVVARVQAQRVAVVVVLVRMSLQLLPTSASEPGRSPLLPEERRSLSEERQRSPFSALTEGERAATVEERLLAMLAETALQAVVRDQVTQAPLRVALGRPANAVFNDLGLFALVNPRNEASPIPIRTPQRQTP